MNLPKRQLNALLVSAIAIAATQPLAGCGVFGGNTPTTKAPAADAIPREAVIVTEGRNQVDYSADTGGTVFVVDVKSKETVLTHQVRKGQRVVVSPDENRVRLDGQVISSSDLKSNHPHRIYLLRDKQSDEESNNERNARDGVPVGARLIGEDINNQISFRADQAGKAYIVDADKHKLIDTVAVGKNQRFIFSPGADRVTIDGRGAIDRDFDPRTNYRIYFDH